MRKESPSADFSRYVFQTCGRLAAVVNAPARNPITLTMLRLCMLFTLGTAGTGTPLKERPDAPDKHRDDEAADSRDGQSNPRGVMRNQFPHDQPKRHQSYATHRGAYGLHARHRASPGPAVESGAFLFLPLMLFHQARGRRENRGKGQKELADFRPKSGSDDPVRMVAIPP
jgi:hypothetical protein